MKQVSNLAKLLNNLAYVDDSQRALGVQRYCLGSPEMV